MRRVVWLTRARSGVKKQVSEEVERVESYLCIGMERVGEVRGVLVPESSVGRWEGVAEEVADGVELRGFEAYLNVLELRRKGFGPLVLVRYTGRERDRVFMKELRFKSRKIRKGDLWHLCECGVAPQVPVSTGDGRVTFLVEEGAMKRAEVDGLVWKIPGRMKEELAFWVRLWTDMSWLGRDDALGCAYESERFCAMYGIDRSERLDVAVRYQVERVQNCLCALNCLALEERTEQYGRACINAVSAFQWSLSVLRRNSKGLSRTSKNLMRSCNNFGRIGEMNLFLFRVLLLHVESLKSLLNEDDADVPDPLEDPESFRSTLRTAMARHEVEPHIFGAFLVDSLSTHAAQQRYASWNSSISSNDRSWSGEQREDALDKSAAKKHKSYPVTTKKNETLLPSHTALCSPEPGASEAPPAPESVDGAHDQASHLLPAYESLKAKYRHIEAALSTFRTEASEVRASVDFLNDLCSEHQRFLDNFQSEFTSLSKFLRENEDAIQNLLCYIAHLENQIQKIRRRSRIGVVKQVFLWISVNFFSLIFLLVLGFVALIDFCRVHFVRNPPSAENLLKTRFQNFGRTQLKKFENAINNIESDMATLAGLRKGKKDA
ncbi:uncharacterized protein LOC126322679 [Schistocerca gregaria]|uniref:uncharacterized protein LOC126322679 n=1 Tax=Schistocerca gregaria TaxID=7010 RepID=UPI00211E3EA8|nr:uncharacterized protein LOC126322679 [Schistocerca gregaria]